MLRACTMPGSLTSTAHVSEVAGVSVGSIYRRFGNKEQLLLATQAEFVRAFLEDFTARLGSEMRAEAKAQ